MKHSSSKKLTLTVGITTCYGGESILETVKSIRASKGVGKFRFILIADRIPIKDAIKKELKKHDVKLIENKIESGQVTKQQQILKMTKSDIIVFTNDDVIFEPYTLATIVKLFKNDPELSLIHI